MRRLLFTCAIFLKMSCLIGVPYESLGEGILIKRNHDGGNSGKKIAIATVIISGKQQHVGDTFQNASYNRIVAFGTKSKELYAKKYGYDFIVATEKFTECYGIPASRDLECSWSKLGLVSRVLDDYDWVFWTDADSIILNFDVKLEDFIDENYDIIACSANTNWQTGTYDGQVKINAGQVFYKNSPFSKQAIIDTWSDHHEITPGSFEQKRFNKVLKSDPEKGRRALIYPGKMFNISPDKYEEGDFLVHMYAYHGRALYYKMLEFEQKYGWILDKQNL